MSFAAQALWRLFPTVRRRERSRFLFFLALFFLLTAAETVGLAGAEALFLARIGIGALPVTFVAASVAAVLGSLVYAALVDALRNDRLFVLLLLLAAGALAVAGGGAALDLRWAFPTLFCIFWLNRAVFLIHFWTFSGDHFDTLSSKRLFPLLAIGGSLGGVVGGVAAAGLGRVAGAEWLIAAWVVLLLAAAGLLASQQARLRRWIPLEQMESDDTSVERLRDADRYLRRSSLGRWLIVSCVGMVVALFVAQYLYSGIFAEAFPEADTLALFFGVYLAVANLAEVGVAAGVSRWLIPRFGVPTANLIHPVLTLLSFVGLTANASVPTALLARANRELLENALASPVRNLTYNALPHRFRGRVRGFLEGIVLHAGMAGAGLLLVLVPSADLLLVCLLGIGASLVYAGANLRVRREYLRALLAELRAGRIDLRELEGEIGAREATLLTEFWRSLTLEAQPSARIALRTARTLVRHGIHEPLLGALTHPRASLRRAALEALVEMRSDAAEPALRAGLADADPGIVAWCLRALAAWPEAARRFDAPIRERLAVPDPALRAWAAAALGEPGLPTLERMLGAGTEQAVAALQALPDAALGLAAARLDHPQPEVRAAAIERLAGVAPPASALPALRANLEHAEARVRLGALRVLAAHPEPELATLLGDRLADPSREVRRLASESLVKLDEAGFAEAQARLGSDRSGAVDASLAVLAGLGTPQAGDALRTAYRERVAQAWWALLALARVPDDGPLARRFLRLALEDALLRNGRLAFAILERLEAPGVVRNVEKALRFALGRARADALEVLSHLGDREGSQLLVTLLEEGSLEERRALVAARVDAPDGEAEVVRSAARLGRWTRAAALALRGGVAEEASEVIMERMLLLRRVPLFAQMTLEQLEAVDELMREVHYMDGEVVCREGEPGDELFVVLEGQVEFYKGAGETRVHLSSTSAGGYFGEMAILSEEPRSATAVVSKPARLLSLRGERLKELLLEMPEICFEIFRVLTARVKTAEGRLEPGAAARASGAINVPASPPASPSPSGDGS